MKDLAWKEENGAQGRNRTTDTRIFSRCDSRRMIARCYAKPRIPNKTAHLNYAILLPNTR